VRSEDEVREMAWHYKALAVMCEEENKREGRQESEVEKSMNTIVGILAWVLNEAHEHPTFDEIVRQKVKELKADYETKKAR
jgi:hypothetical protein